ncbi:unnamed protein product [Heterobilharzia americana]|nr:unnamed protein product [Heterobilharzia americana]CAH8509157.1 unnamed protein product [Heterobilharzia americana]
MVMQRFSEPSSPNTNDTTDDNHQVANGVINWNEYSVAAGGIGPGGELTDQTTPVGYVLLGSEIVHAADEGGNDSETDDMLSDSENERVGNTVIVEHESSIQSFECRENSDSPRIDVDQLLNRQLCRTEFEPRGAFAVSSLVTNIVEDSSHIDLWNTNAHPSSSQITITPDEADTIKTCMSNFHLPVSRYPLWATQIPEELWKAKLLEKLGNKYQS